MCLIFHTRSTSSIVCCTLLLRAFTSWLYCSPVTFSTGRGGGSRSLQACFLDSLLVRSTTLKHGTPSRFNTNSHSHITATRLVVSISSRFKPHYIAGPPKRIAQLVGFIFSAASCTNHLIYSNTVPNSLIAVQLFCSCSVTLKPRTGYSRQCSSSHSCKELIDSAHRVSRSMCSWCATCCPAKRATSARSSSLPTTRSCNNWALLRPIRCRLRCPRGEAVTRV